MGQGVVCSGLHTGLSGDTHQLRQPREDEVKNSVSDRFAADRTKLASKATTDPLDKNEAKRKLDAELEAEKPQEERKTKNSKDCPSKDTAAVAATMKTPAPEPASTPAPAPAPAPTTQG